MDQDRQMYGSPDNAGIIFADRPIKKPPPKEVVFASVAEAGTI